MRTISTDHLNRVQADNVVAAVREAGSKAIALQLDAGNAHAFDPCVQEMSNALGGDGSKTPRKGIMSL